MLPLIFLLVIYFYSSSLKPKWIAGKMAQKGAGHKTCHLISPIGSSANRLEIVHTVLYLAMQTSHIMLYNASTNTCYENKK
jgi:hypothetical protein